MDKQEAYNKLLYIHKQIDELDLFPSLGWLWCFDIIKDIFDNNQYDDLATNDYVDEAVPSGTTLFQIFDKFYDDIDSLGISMEHGGEILEEVIRDWMRENNYLVSLDDDSWLDEEGNNE